MSVRWLLVRHGATEWSETGRYAGQTDVPLSPRGRDQAHRLAARLAGEPVGIAYTSDLARARETLELLLAGRASSAQVIPCSELRELRFGQWEGHTYAEIASAPAGQAVLRGEAAAPGGESLAQMGKRVARFLARLQADALVRPDETALVVAHGGPLRVLLSAALGLPVAAQWRFQIDPASRSELAWDVQTGARLVLLNDRCHVESEVR